MLLCLSQHVMLNKVKIWFSCSVTVVSGGVMFGGIIVRVCIIEIFVRDLCSSEITLTNAV